MSHELKRIHRPYVVVQRSFRQTPAGHAARLTCVGLMFPTVGDHITSNYFMPHAVTYKNANAMNVDTKFDISNGTVYPL